MEVANERCDASNVPDTTDSAQIAPEGASGLEEIAAEKEIAVLQGDDRADEKGEESGTVAQLATDAKVTEQSFDVVQGKQLSNVTVDDVSAAAVLLTDNEAIAQSGQSKEAADGAEGTDERHAVGGEQIGVVVAGDEHRLTDLTMEGGALEETNEEGAHSTAKTEVTKRDDAQKEEQGEEAHEEAGMKEWTEDTIEGEADIGENVEETRGVSVVASTHDISSETDLTRLTESELQLGKVKPVWIADSETASCMLCCAKFTLILRRHHCRSCGRVLCGQCTAYKAVLPYMNDSSKKFKVCEPCLQTLQRIDDYEKGIGLQEDSTDASTNEPGASSSALSADIPRMTKSVLKVKSSEASNEAAEGGERPSGTGDVAKRSVTFRDGVNPGDGTADKGVTDAAIAPEPSNLIPKPKKKRASVVRRVKELRMEEENVCLLPKEADDPLYTRRANGAVEKLENLEEVQRRLADEEIVVIAVSLDCCGLGRVMCVSSSGMFAVGLDEIMIVYDLDEDEQPSLPVNIIHRIHEIYECSLKPQNESFDEKMGIRAVHLRVPPLHSTLRKNEQDDFAGRDILLFRPSLQCFDNLVLPSWPFLVACFVQQCEKLWAMAIPNRLLYRIGLQASYYPTPIVNRRGREPVYTPVTDTTVLKVFIDFRNWSYRMLMVHGSTLELQDNGSRLVVPTWAKGEVCSRSTIWKYSIGSCPTLVSTPSHLSHHLTGASFIIVDGALKSADVPLTVNVVEDGIAIRLRADAMKAFAEAISAGEDYVLESSAMKFSLEWRNTPLRADSLGQLVSPVDQSSLMGNYEYGLIESRILSSLYSIPSVNEWALRLVAVYNMANGKFAPLIQSKVFAVSEQIAAQIAYTLVPFVDTLITNNIREISLRIRVTSDDAGYVAAKWANMEQEHSTWRDLLDNQLVPGLFNICSFIPSGFEAELSMALVSTRPLP
ncbi:Zinc finger FYVE domain-containing protein 9 [Toxocara canis]|uniref:Zinc finger FYVE domain-containing protein 9 n=1 Tax=Toxocara canis TaxID=6265 RepID=A0A0B2VK65_TOXCA|nr:Zinc finger FYVE domain-containing protein 9 [Toxocara canis]